jgi:RNA-directed DNA polymerase
VKISSKANPFLPEYDKYFSRRKNCSENLARVCKQITTFDDKETNINSRVARRRASLKSA